MKAIIFEDNKGVKNFLPFASEKKMYTVFKKICLGTGTFFCESKKDFDKIKERENCLQMTEIFYKNFIGVGTYDYEGNFHHQIIQEEGKYWIGDYDEQTKDVVICKILLDKVLLN